MSLFYPPVFGTNPQQAAATETISSIAAYLLLALFLIVPLWYMYRRSKKRGHAKA
jgi:cbb3-type cytochrome oxidase subunit 3